MKSPSLIPLPQNLKSASTVGQALAAMVGRRALVVGDFMLDAYVYGETVRVSREAPVLVVRKEQVEYRLGGAANTAVNLQALGLQTHLVGAVGQDTAGQRLHAMLTSTGAHVGHVLSIPRVTPMKTRILAGAFGTCRQQVLRLDDEPQDAMDPTLEHLWVQALEKQAPEVDVVVASDYGIGTVGPAVIQALQSLARQGMTVCVDSRYQLHRFGGVTVVTPNVPEAESMLGLVLHSPEAVAQAGQTLLKRLESQACVLTQGRDGMTLFRPCQAPCHVDSVGSQEVTDVTGAGDTVLATLGAALAAGIGLDNGMRLANCAAGVVVSKAGATSVTPDEIAAAAQQGHVTLQAWDGLHL